MPFRDPFRHIVNVSLAGYYILVTIELTNVGPAGDTQSAASAPSQSLVSDTGSSAELIDQLGDPQSGFLSFWAYTDLRFRDEPALFEWPAGDESFFPRFIDFTNFFSSSTPNDIGQIVWFVWWEGQATIVKQYLLKVGAFSDDPACRVSLADIYPEASGSDPATPFANHGQAHLQVDLYRTGKKITTISDIVGLSPISSVSSAFLHDNWLPGGDYPIVVTKTSPGDVPYVNIVDSPADWFVIDPPI
jgi:hypothetical protein